MTIIASCNGVLYADSAVVHNNGQWFSRLTEDGKKIYISSCKRVAMASTGFTTTSDNYERIARVFIGKIAAWKATGEPQSMAITIVERRELAIPDARFIILTTHGVYEYDATGWTTGIQVSELDHMVYAGMPVAQLHAALMMGLPLDKALAVACKLCKNSRLPIHSVSIADLVPFSVVTEELPQANNFRTEQPA